MLLDLKLPRVGGLIDPNKEAILALKPDLVIVYETQAELKQQLERAGIPIFNYVHKGLPDITATIRSRWRYSARAMSKSPARSMAAATCNSSYISQGHISGSCQ